MTRQHLRVVLGCVILIYALALAAGVTMRVKFPPVDGKESMEYSAYKDLIPLLIAIPAAYLAFCFQRRNSCLQALRSLWGNMVAAVQSARAYTYIPEPTQELYGETLGKLSMVIEEVRGVFKNIPSSTSSVGLYPFEPIKDIFYEISRLGCGKNITAEAQQAARHRINVMWKHNRTQLLAEFDRDKPTFHHAKSLLSESDIDSNKERWSGQRSPNTGPQADA